MNSSAQKPLIYMPSIDKIAKAISVVSGLLVILYLSIITHSLFTRLGASYFESTLSIFSSVGLLVASAMIVASFPKNRVRALGLVYIVVLSFVCVGLAGLEIGFRQRLLVVPDVIRYVGEVGVMFLGVMGAIWVVTMLIAYYSVSDTPTISAALSDYLSFLVKLFALGSSSLATAYFGASKGVPAVLSVFLSFILESTLIWSYISLSASKARGDVFDSFMWGLVLVILGTLVAMISVETISTVSNINIPWLVWLRESGDTIFVSAVGFSVIVITITHVLTSLIDVRANPKKSAESSSLKPASDDRSSNSSQQPQPSSQQAQAIPQQLPIEI